MTLDLKKLSEFALAATPGPWYAGTVHVYQTNHITRDIWNVAAPPYSGMREHWDKDRAYIAAFDPPTTLALLDRIEEMEKMNNNWMLDAQVDDARISALEAQLKLAREAVQRVAIQVLPQEYEEECGDELDDATMAEAYELVVLEARSYLTKLDAMEGTG